MAVVTPMRRFMSKHVTPDTLIEDLQGVVHDTEALLTATAGQAGEKIQAARGRAEESLRRAKARLRDVDGEALKRARALAGEADEYVRDNPWQVIGAAAGIALLLGLLASRR
jgi:ElaB/YqjD/DUF883 family membrane-anchored ribosome-binding protein